MAQGSFAGHQHARQDGRNAGRPVLRRGSGCRGQGRHAGRAREAAARDALGDQFNELSPEQKKQLGYDLEGLKLRLRIDPNDLPISMANALLLTRRREGDFVVIAPAQSVDSRLAPDERVPFQTTARQLMSLHGRGVIDKLTPDGSIRRNAEVRQKDRTRVCLGARSQPFAGWRSGHA